MPCRCCSATKPPKGMKPDEQDKNINSCLKLAVDMIKQRYSDPLYDEIEWRKEWLLAFEHHLFGCTEKGE